MTVPGPGALPTGWTRQTASGRHRRGRYAPETALAETRPAGKVA
jgi:hypothetical protein